MQKNYTINRLLLFTLSFIICSCSFFKKHSKKNEKSIKIVNCVSYGDSCESYIEDRIYLNDSIFISFFQFKKQKLETLSVDTFKIIGEDWWRMNSKCGGFLPYFSKNGFENKETIHTYINDCEDKHSVKIIPKRKEIFNDEILYHFEVISYYSNSPVSEFWFEPKIGIVKTHEKSLYNCDTIYYKVESTKYISKKKANKLISQKIIKGLDF